MKGRIVTTALAMTVVLTACSKENIQPNDTSILSRNVSSLQENNLSVYTSEWETVSAWKSEKGANASSFSYSRATPQISKNILDKGVVIVFARNLWADDPAFKDMGAADKPLRMPFYFLPLIEQPDYTEQWNFAADEQKVNLSLNIKGTGAPNGKVQFRFIVIPQEVIDKKAQTSEAVRRMTYDQLLKAFDLAS